MRGTPWWRAVVWSHDVQERFSSRTQCNCCSTGAYNSGPGPFFHNFLTSDPGPKEKRRILPESTAALRIHGYLCQLPEVAGVIFSDSNSALFSKFWNPGPDPVSAIFQIWESDSCSDSSYNHQSNLNLPMFLLKKWPHRLLLLPKLKSDSESGPGFSQILTPGLKEKTHNPAGVDSGTGSGPTSASYHHVRRDHVTRSASSFLSECEVGTLRMEVAVPFCWRDLRCCCWAKKF